MVNAGPTLTSMQVGPCMLLHIRMIFIYGYSVKLTFLFWRIYLSVNKVMCDQVYRGMVKGIWEEQTHVLQCTTIFNHQMCNFIRGPYCILNLVSKYSNGPSSQNI